MRVVNIHEAKTQLSRLIEHALKGEDFIIAKAGKPLVKVSAIVSVAPNLKRVGFMTGQIQVPGDFDRMGQEHIENLFGAQP